MLLPVEIVDIVAPLIILNTSDAKAIGIREGDRALITDPKTNHAITMPVTISKSVTECNKATLTAGANKDLQIESGDSINIIPFSRPESIECIRKKIDGKKLSRDDTAKIVRDITTHTLSTAEVTAYLTATYINGMDMDETEYLAREIMMSGDTISFKRKPVVDKHSIGGVPGNKITLLIVPIIASSGLLIPKTSSRAITGAGGTADLMEALAPVSFSASEIQQMTEKVGGVISWGGSTNIVPADDIMIRSEYPLKMNGRGKMLASIIAKKAAVGADICVIDIPVGPGTKMADEREGKILASELIELGRRLGINVECAITYGDAPIGRTIGVNLEVAEALQFLENEKKQGSLLKKSAEIAGIALEMAGKASRGTGAAVAIERIQNGKALLKMRDIIEIQGGDPKIKSTDLMPGDFSYNVGSSVDGMVVSVNNRVLVDIARAAGSPIDHGAGIVLHKKPGEIVKKGDTIITIYAEKEWRLTNALELARITNPINVSGMLLARVAKDDF